MTTSQSWNPDDYAAKARFVSDLATPVIELLAPQKGERILDLGCGDGVIVEKLNALGCSAVGVDGSPDMVKAAQKRELDARLMDGHRLSFTNEFDAVFSNAALHWMKDPDAVIAGVAKALKPGGRFVAEFGGYGNVTLVEQAINEAFKARGMSAASLNPWYFPTVEDYKARLEQGGFRVEEIALHPRPTELPGDIADWLSVFAGTFVGALPEKARHAFVDEVRDLLHPKLFKNGVWVVDYVRLRFKAVLGG
jgi:trans-aconitate methyltransferase